MSRRRRSGFDPVATRHGPGPDEPAFRWRTAVLPRSTRVARSAAPGAVPGVLSGPAPVHSAARSARHIRDLCDRDAAWPARISALTRTSPARTAPPVIQPPAPRRAPSRRPDTPGNRLSRLIFRGFRPCHPVPASRWPHPSGRFSIQGGTRPRRPPRGPASAPPARGGRPGAGWPRLVAPSPARLRPRSRAPPGRAARRPAGASGAETGGPGAGRRAGFPERRFSRNPAVDKLATACCS